MTLFNAPQARLRLQSHRTEEGSGVVRCVAIVSRTSSILVRDSPCILASPSTTRHEIPGISCDSSTPSSMKQQGPPRPAQRRPNSSHQPPPGFQHEDVGLHDDKSEPDWLQCGSPSRTSKGRSWRPKHYVQQLPQGMRTELRRRLD